MGHDQRFETSESLDSSPKSNRQTGLTFSICAFLFLSACGSSTPKNAPSTSEPVIVAKKLDMTSLGFQLTATGVNEMPSVSKDEKQMVFVSSERPGHQQSQIYIYDINNLTERRVTFQDGDCRDPLFVEQGKKIVYSSNTDELKENPLLFDKSLESPEAKAATAASSMELYLSDISGADIKRLTTRRGFDGSAWQRMDRPISLIYSVTEAGATQAWQINIEQAGQAPILHKKDISILSLRPSPSIKKWAWIEKNKEGTTSVLISTGHTPGFKEQKASLPVGDYQDLAWLDDERLIFSAKITIDPKKTPYYQLYSYDIGKNCLEKIFESNSNLKSPQLLKNQQSLIFVSDLSKSWQIYSKALPASTGQCL